MTDRTPPAVAVSADDGGRIVVKRLADYPYALDFDWAEQWIVATDSEGASQIVARDVERGFGTWVLAALAERSRLAASPSPEPPTAPCPECAGQGWVVVEGVTYGCCGNVLLTGECCAAEYGDANLVPEPTQEQGQCPTCGGSGRVAEPPTADLRAALDAIIAAHDDGSGYSRFGGDAILNDLRAALAASPRPAPLNVSWLRQAIKASGWGVGGDTGIGTAASTIATAYLAIAEKEAADG